MSDIPRTDRPRAKVVLLVLLVLVVGYLLWSNINTKIHANRAGEQAQAVAGPVDALCAQPGPVATELRLRGACSAAAQVQQSPAVAPPVTSVVSGSPGPPGRGVASTNIVDGRLRITYTDGTTEDKGVVVGAPGANGVPGRGITGTAIVAGHLVLTYSDATSEDAGQVVGPTGEKGRGVASSAVVNGRLIITYSDDTTQDAGPLPVGRGVQRAEVVDCRWKVTYTDGVTEDAGNACTTATVTPTTTTTAGLPLLTGR